jgi:hypothetical protein
MSFRPEDLHDLDTAVEVRIETFRDAKSTRSTVIWVVVDQGEVFVRSVLGLRGRWYQEALANPEVTIDDAGRRLEAVAVPVNDPDSRLRVDAALRRKYAESASGFPPMLTPEARTANLRLDARVADEASLQAPAYLDAEEPSELGMPVEIGMLDAGPAIEERVALQPHKSA